MKTMISLSITEEKINICKLKLFLFSGVKYQICFFYFAIYVFFLFLVLIFSCNSIVIKYIIRVLLNNIGSFFLVYFLFRLANSLALLFILHFRVSISKCLNNEFNRIEICLIFLKSHHQRQNLCTFIAFILN